VALKLANKDGNTYVVVGDDDVVRIGTAGSERVTIDENGRIGIGTTDPATTLQVNTQSSAARFLDSVNDRRIDINPRSLKIDSNSVLYLNRDSAGNVILVNGGGNVGIGTASPGYKFEVVDNVDGYVAKFFNDGNSLYRKGILIQAGTDDGSGQYVNFILALTGDGTSTGVIRTNNGVFELVDLSDKRIKENIRDTSINALKKINAIKVRDFNFKHSPSIKLTGFIAQELEDICPEAVSVVDENKNLKGIARTALIPIIVKAIQEISQEIQNLKEQLNALRLRGTTQTAN